MFCQSLSEDSHARKLNKEGPSVSASNLLIRGKISIGSRAKEDLGSREEREVINGVQNYLWGQDRR